MGGWAKRRYRRRLHQSAYVVAVMRRGVTEARPWPRLGPVVLLHVTYKRRGAINNGKAEEGSSV